MDLPHLQFQPNELKMLPKSVVAAAATAMEGSELPPGFG
jgi:hypothetical protein